MFFIHTKLQNTKVRLIRLGLQVRRVFCEVHTLIVDQDYRGAILPIKMGGVSSRSFMMLCHLLYRTVVDLQRNSYRSLTAPQPADAMLHPMHAREGGCLGEGVDEFSRNARRSEEADDGWGTRVKRALLVEDHRLFREALAAMLEEHTDLKRTVQTGSLAEARRLWERLSGEIHLVIVDLDLTNGDEMSLIDNLREAEPDVPVLAFTNARSLEQRARALRAGADEVLTMETSSEQIIDTAERLLGG
jgi:CheY-like chemotaxis protein